MPPRTRNSRKREFAAAGAFPAAAHETTGADAPLSGKCRKLPAAGRPILLGQQNHQLSEVLQCQDAEDFSL